MKKIYILLMTMFLGLNISYAQSKIEDADGDTHIETEHAIAGFNDQIHFTVDGNLKWKMVGDRFETGNPSANVMIGYGAGEVNTGTINTFIGNFSGYNNTSGHNNVALGLRSLESNVNGSYNTALGAGALESYQSAGNNGSYSTSVGNHAGSELTSGFANTLLGANAGRNIASGGYNCIMGMSAGKNKTTSSRNILIGYGANSEGAAGHDNIIIGFQAARFETGSHKLYIENSSSSDPLIYGEFDNDELTINGFATVDRIDGAEEVARFVSHSEPMLTLYRGNTYAGHMQHYKQDLVLSNRIDQGSVRIEAKDGNVHTVGEFFADGDFKAYGDRFFFGTAERFRDAGGNLIESNSSIIPSNCGLRDLGRSSKRWDQVYIDNAVLIGSCFSSGGGSGSGALADGQSDHYGLNEIMELKSVQGFKNKSNEITVTQLQEVMPALVEEYDEIIDEKTEEVTLVPTENPSIRITDFIPVLVKSEQEQQLLIEEQAETINKLESKLERLLESVQYLEKAVYAQNQNESILNQEPSSVTLTQNQPNPASDRAVIFYSSDEAFKRGYLRIVNMQGMLIREIVVSEKQGAVSVDTSDLIDGHYFYRLILDGKQMASKRMLIAH